MKPGFQTKYEAWDASRLFREELIRPLFPHLFKKFPHNLNLFQELFDANSHFTMQAVHFV